MAPSSIIQLNRQVDIALWPEFERRCRDFCTKYNKSQLAFPLDAIIDEMLQRWLREPALCGYFLAPETGHVASWIVNYYGIIKLFIWQAESAGESKLEPLMAALLSWINKLNSNLPPNLQCHQAEWLTWRPEAIWRRYMKKLQLTPAQTHNLIEMAI